MLRVESLSKAFSGFQAGADANLQGISRVAYCTRIGCNPCQWKSPARGDTILKDRQRILRGFAN